LDLVDVPSSLRFSSLSMVDALVHRSFGALAQQLPVDQKAFILRRWFFFLAQSYINKLLIKNPAKKNSQKYQTS
jgi:hypothetical protein